MRKEIAIEGMSCSHCAMAVEKVLRGVAGVQEVTVDLAGKRAILAGEGLADVALKAAVENAGYQVVAIR